MLLVGCDSDQLPEKTLAPDPPKLRLEVIDTRKELTWGAVVYDFNRDGALDFMLNGHAQAPIDRVYYRDGEAFVPSEFVFPRSADRHACAADDVNVDGHTDVYCTEGAVKGTGEGLNQLFLGESQGKFRLVTEDHGALDPTARGRQVEFFRFNRDEYPDLYVTTWGPREDEALNENSVFLNQAGLFKRVPSPLTGTQGQRCLNAQDINQDGLDDVLLCRPGSGGSLFLSLREEVYVHLVLPNPKLWWSDIDLGDINGDSLTDLLVLNGDGQLRVYFHSGDHTAPYQRLAFSHVGRDDLPAKEVSQKKLSMISLAMADVNGDGAPDVYIARSTNVTGPEPIADTEDLVLLGPDLNERIIIPIASAGRAYRAYGLGDRFLVLNSGERWKGEVLIVSLDEP